MSTTQKHSAYTVRATADLSGLQYHVITLAGTIATSTSRVGGVQVTKAQSGEDASLVYEGITKCRVGGAVSTVGYPLTVNGSGTLTACASGGAAVGRALTTAASGDICPVLVNFSHISAWPGV